MSLINDALKRARQVHVRQPAPTVLQPVGEPALVPVPSPRTSSSQVPWLIPGGTVVAVLLAVWLISLWWRTTRSVQATVAPETTNGMAEVMAAVSRFTQQRSNSPAPAPEWSHSSSPGVKLASDMPSPTPTPAAQSVAMPTISAAPPPAPAPASATPVAAPAAQESGTVDTPVQPPAPAGPSYKLQAIFYRNSQASAVINGQTVFLGDDIDGAKLVDIERQFVRLAVNGKTNLVKLH